MAHPSGNQYEPHVIVAKSGAFVYLSVDGIEYRMSAKLARQTGDALYKAGCDAEQHGINAKESS